MTPPDDAGNDLHWRAGDAQQATPIDAIDEAMIQRLVHAFYGKVRVDAELGPIFAARVVDWGPHIERMCAFWSSVMLRTSHYDGRPMQKHAPLPMGAAHFDRWLALFAATAQEVCPAVVAAQFIARARMIAASLEFGIATHRGQQLSAGERLPPLASLSDPA